MKIDAPALLAPPAHAAQPGGDPPACTTEVYLQLGALTRLLHDTLQHLGVMPALRCATDGLPDARSRLAYIADKSGHAAHRVLNAVDQAKAEHRRITAETRALAEALQGDPVGAVSSGAVFNFVADVECSTARIDSHLTDIMLAQDFHDLTGQVVAQVVTLASGLEESLVRLLVSVVPPEQQHKVTQVMAPGGPVVDPARRSDVVTNQREVDDLLASLGF